MVFNDVMNRPRANYATIQEFWHDAPAAVPLIRDAGASRDDAQSGMMWGAFDKYPHVLKIVRPLAVLVIFFLLKSLPSKNWTARLALTVGISARAARSRCFALPRRARLPRVDFDFRPCSIRSPRLQSRRFGDLRKILACSRWGCWWGKKAPERSVAWRRLRAPAGGLRAPLMGRRRLASS